MERYTAKAVKLGEDISVKVTSRALTIKYFDNSEQKMLIVKKEVSLDSLDSSDLKNAVIIENIPKKVAENVNNLIIDESLEILKDDPILVYKLSGDSSVKYSYVIKDKFEHNLVQETASFIIQDYSEFVGKKSSNDLTGFAIFNGDAESSTYYYLVAVLLFIGVLAAGFYFKRSRGNQGGNSGGNPGGNQKNNNFGFRFLGFGGVKSATVGDNRENKLNLLRDSMNHDDSNVHINHPNSHQDNIGGHDRNHKDHNNMDHMDRRSHMDRMNQVSNPVTNPVSNNGTNSKDYSNNHAFNHACNNSDRSAGNYQSKYHSPLRLKPLKQDMNFLISSAHSEINALNLDEANSIYNEILDQANHSKNKKISKEVKSQVNRLYKKLCLLSMARYAQIHRNNNDFANLRIALEEISNNYNDLAEDMSQEELNLMREAKKYHELYSAEMMNLNY